MARYFEPTVRQVRAWKRWVAKRPPAVRALAERYEPWTLYRLGHSRVYVHAYSEDGTVTVVVSARFNAVLFERQVFGVNPAELIECDLPDEDEPLGAAIAKPTEADMQMIRKAMGIRHKHEVN